MGKANSRGQTLVLVVLIMLVVALLAALLVAVIISNQARIGRSGSIAALNNTVEAGLRYADYQLTYSADGADWRPVPATANPPFPYTFGRGQFKLTLSYDPSAAGELADFIKIECTACLLDSKGDVIPSLRRTQTAYKPVLLADYLRFITNKDRSSLPAVLGVPSVLQGASEVAYATAFEGPIRSNADIQWRRDSTTLTSTLLLSLVDGGTYGGFTRRDRIQTAGNFTLADGAQVRRWTGAAWSGNVNADASTDANFDVTLGLGSGIACYVDGVNRTDINNVLRNIRYQQPPSVDVTDPTTGQSRYLLLTRDSGAWSASAPYYNTGWYGYGKGIYVDNFGDIQFTHNLSSLRNDWMNPTPIATYATTLTGWDTAGWSYHPYGVEIILHAGNSTQADIYGYNYPVIELRADTRTGSPSLMDRNGDSSNEYWLNPDRTDYTGFTTPNGTVLPNSVLLLPYPQNGVLYAEGNVRVAGVLPPASSPTPNQYYVDATNRFYDLSIVSGGTIYIEGDVMSPWTYQNNGGLWPTALTSASDLRNTRLALLARDHVCLNLTAFGARYDPAAITNPSPLGSSVWNVPDVNCWNTTLGQGTAFWFRSWQPTGTALTYLRHAGQSSPTGIWNDGTGINRVYSVANLYVDNTDDGVANGANFNWGAGVNFQFSNPIDPSLPAIVAGLSASDRTLDNPAPAMNWEVSVRNLTASLSWGGVRNYIVLTVPVAGSTNDYRLAGFQVLPSKINLDALVFAQEGSWFVLPGPWFNGAWNNTGNDVDNTGPLTTVPSYRMALGAIPAASGGAAQPAIVFNGAITESHTAALGDAHDWLSKWSGPQALISYTFDGGLRATPYYDAGGNKLPRIPKLPCPPGLIIWGKQ